MSEPEQTPLDQAKRFSVDNYAYRSAPRLGVRGWLRWGWRQVTSMRLALVLLLMLGLAAIPGSLLPQWPTNGAKTQSFIDNNPGIGPWLDHVGLLDVFGSAWFTSIYVLLFLSLIGCIIPRAVAHGKAARVPVASAPSSLARYDGRLEASSPLSQAEAVAAVRAWGRGHLVWGWLTGYRVRVDERTARDGTPQVAVALEQGSLREWGNLVFHTALVGLLCALAFGSAYTYRGQAIVVEGQTFTNAAVEYDSFSAGRLFDPAWLKPFTLTLDKFVPVFDLTGRPVSFTAHVTYAKPGKAAEDATIKVNHPLGIDGGNIYLQGNGYAPMLTVRDAAGNVAFSGPTPFLPQDGVYTSTGVVKVPDVTSGPQIGLVGTLYPTAAQAADGTVSSVNPQAVNPVMLLTAYKGDLGLDTGIPQNVYQLDQTKLTQVLGDDGKPLVIDITLGQTVTLPDGLGTVTWDSLPRFVALDLRADPSLPWVLGMALAVLLGIAVSLFAPRRRLWLVFTHSEDGDVPGGRTLVEAAALAPPHDEAAARALASALAVSAGLPVPRPSARQEE
ncbi:cytochrome c biogenesis protein ResB [Demequina lutea]|uniref:Cytochrome c biogenesis protein n=1 Tax=Demequina lutea TaxID=431489 RepID=A0A7Y9ZFE0_9MICO|nr:cytochrome c biogenesis protein ResB [Demequina lutea]NYI42386.1 cytochrome c biogenesis protein [Demequina lutea]